MLNTTQKDNSYKESTIESEKNDVNQENLDNNIETKIQNQFNEEKWTRISAKDVSISRFKILEDIFSEATKQNKIPLIETESKKQLEEYKNTIAARYFLGVIALENNNQENIIYLKQLLDQFQEASKWSVVEYISDKMLAVSENRALLASKAVALEKLNKTKELIPVYEKLSKLDSRNPDLSLKFADIIIHDNIEKGIQLYKQVAEIYAKNKNFEKLKFVWNKLIEFTPDDFQFFTKIERILNSYRKKETIVELYVQIINIFIKKENIDNILISCKKILEYNPIYTRFRNELIRAYRQKYKDHSLLDDFLKYSGILDSRNSVQNTISRFENYIVFDKDNYVYHRNWGVGQIKEITKDFISIAFKIKENHRMEIQMALHSLKPIEKNHFWAYKYKDINYLKELFETNLVEFIKILLISYDNQISFASIRNEIIGDFIVEEQWTKWWAKNRSEILKDENITISNHKKDILEYKQLAISVSDILMSKFQSAESYAEKVSIAVDAVKLKKEGEDVLDFIVTYCKDSINSLDIHTQILTILVLDMAKEYFKEESYYYTDLQRNNFIQNLNNITIEQVSEINSNLKNLDLKRLFATLLHKHYKNWESAFINMLLELPIKSHKYLINILVTEEKWNSLNQFLSTLRQKFREKSEIFLWLLKYIITHNINITGINWKENILCCFRILRSLDKIEQKGTKLKNTVKEIIIGNHHEFIFQIIKEHCSDSLRNISSLLKDTQFLNDIEKEKLQNQLIVINPELFQEENPSESSKTKMDDILKYLEKNSKFIVSASALEKMRQNLDTLLTVEIPNNSKEIGVAQERGDLRENAEYKAAMEKQSLLQNEVKRLEKDILSSEVIKQEQIPNGIICIGSKVKLKDEKTDNIFLYTIMDNWDADIEHGIISYRSPLGKQLLGNRENDTVKFQIGNQKEQIFKVLSISKAIDTNSQLL